MAADSSTDVPEAEYEVLDRRNGKVNIEIMVPGQRQPVRHGIKVDDLKNHPEGCDACIEERVQRIAARRFDPEDDDLTLPEGGSAQFDPSTRDGKPANTGAAADSEQTGPQ